MTTNEMKRRYVKPARRTAGLTTTMRRAAVTLAGRMTRRLAMTLLLAVMTATAWADPTIYIEPSNGGSVEVKNGTQIYVTANSGWKMTSIMWYENDPHGEGGGASVACSDSYMGYYTAPNSGGYVVVTFKYNWPFTVSKSEGSDVYDVLTISGTGAMVNLYKEEFPWWPYHETIKTVVVNEGVTTVGANAFDSFTALTSVSLPSTVTSINAFSFRDCTSLTSVEFPANLTTIMNYSFDNCSSLTSIDIPASVTSIQNLAFNKCTSLASVTVRATTPPTLGIEVFNSNATGRKIYVFSDCVSTYQTNWSAYASAIEAINVTANDAGGSWGRWGTYYNGLADVTVADGTTVYKAALNGAKTGVVLTETGSRIVKRGEAVLLNTTAASLPLSSATDGGDGNYDGNELQGVDYQTAQAEGTTYYVLSKKDSHGFGFYRLADGTALGANKAYLAVSGSPSLARGFLGLGDDETPGTTGIEAQTAADNQDCEVYDLTGRRVEKPVRGIYVKQGRKFIVK